MQLYLQMQGRSISDLLQVESFGVTGCACRKLTFEDIVDLVRVAHPQSDLDQGSDDDPYHVVQEVIGADGDQHLLAVIVNINIVDLPDRRFGLFYGRKAAEIVDTDVALSCA